MLSWIKELAPYGILTTDSNLIIRSWNEWLETHSGLAAPIVVGRPLLEVFPDLITRKLDAHFQRALAGEITVLSTAFHEYLLPFPSTVREAGYEHMLLPSGLCTNCPTARPSTGVFPYLPFEIKTTCTPSHVIRVGFDLNQQGQAGLQEPPALFVGMMVSHGMPPRVM